MVGNREMTTRTHTRRAGRVQCMNTVFHPMGLQAAFMAAHFLRRRAVSQWARSGGQRRCIISAHQWCTQCCLNASVVIGVETCGRRLPLCQVQLQRQPRTASGNSPRRSCSASVELTISRLRVDLHCSRPSARCLSTASTRVLFVSRFSRVREASDRDTFRCSLCAAT